MRLVVQYGCESIRRVERSGWLRGAVGAKGGEKLPFTPY